MNNRSVLFIPLEELENQFATNDRQDIKIVAPNILSEDLHARLVAAGKAIKKETPLVGDEWTYSPPADANKMCESRDFIAQSTPQYDFGPFSLILSDFGPFAVSFANELASQDVHYHRRHCEIYFSQYRLTAQYRPLLKPSQKDWKARILENGGLIIFGPEVIHKVTMAGLTVIMEFPSVADDKVAVADMPPTST